MGGCTSGNRPIKLLSLPYANIRKEYDVVVVGSGYGGSIAASRAARMGFSVAVLEKGKEWPIGSFPETSEQACKEIQTNFPSPDSSSSSNLYSWNIQKDVVIFHGCGLGGTSLINANVNIMPTDKIFEQKEWPTQFRKEWAETKFSFDVKNMQDMLRPSLYPDSYPVLPKSKVFQSLSTMSYDIEDLGDVKFTKLPLNVNFVDVKQNHVGIPQRACTNCGNCTSGCNIGAKNTTYMNYLPDAVNHGAEIFTETSVSYLEPDDGKHWIIHYTTPNNNNKNTIRCKYVFLGAGVLGSTEILQRSAAHGLPLSDRLGQGFSGNGDKLCWSFNGKEVNLSIGRNKKQAKKLSSSPGPCLTSMLDVRYSEQLENQFVVEDATIPHLLLPSLKALFTLSAGTFLPEYSQKSLDCTTGYGVMSQDDFKGVLSLNSHDKIQLDWPNVASQNNFRHAREFLESTAEYLEAKYVDTLSSSLLGNKMVTVHPLGGCGMGNTIISGVVSHNCKVFRKDKGKVDSTFDNLFVVDAACIPRCLGINPSCTISIIAERAMRLFAKEIGKPIHYNFM